MRFYCCIFLLLIGSVFVKAQTFYSLEEAKKHPEKVEVLILKKKKYKALPKEILAFENLRVLDLSRNKIQYLPEELTALSNLEELILNRNDIRALPKEMGKMPKLRQLDLWSNYIDSLPDSFHGNTTLKLLDMRGIVVTSDKQAAIRQMLPNTEILFSKSCNCH
jgi:Leucine-rich repeat (LRR) protein